MEATLKTRNSKKTKRRREGLGPFIEPPNN
jgi:hypothetical protein